jgi:hypothetical protein
MITRMQQDYNILTTDEQFLQHIVLNNHVKIYQITLQMIKRERANSTTPLVLESTKREIRQIDLESIAI